MKKIKTPFLYLYNKGTLPAKLAFITAFIAIVFLILSYLMSLANTANTLNNLIALIGVVFLFPFSISLLWDMFKYLFKQKN